MSRHKATTAEKLAILAEVENRGEGVSVPMIAKRHGITVSLVYYWIDRKRRGVLTEEIPQKVKAATKRKHAPIETQLAAVHAAATRPAGVSLDAIAKAQGVSTARLRKWIHKHGTLAPPTNGRGPPAQLALAGVESLRAAPEIAPTYVNSSGPVPESLQVALLQRNNSVLKALIHQLVEHL